MGARERLERIKDLDRKIDSKLKERERLVRYNGYTKIEEGLVERLRRYDEEVNDYIDELLNLKIDVVGEIEQLDNFNHQMVLRERYLHSKKWEEIEEEHHYDIRHLHRLHNQALKELAKIKQE